MRTGYALAYRVGVTPWESYATFPRRASWKRQSTSTGARFMVGDVTHLPVSDLDRFDFFLDAGCFQHLNPEQPIVLGTPPDVLVNYAQESDETFGSYPTHVAGFTRLPAVLGSGRRAT